MTHLSYTAAKATTDLCYNAIPEAVEAYPAATPIVIARGLVDRLTSDECRLILEQLVAQRVRTCQQVRSHTRHQVSEHDAVTNNVAPQIWLQDYLEQRGRAKLKDVLDAGRDMKGNHETQGTYDAGLDRWHVSWRRIP
jgi:hypothetical protein